MARGHKNILKNKNVGHGIALLFFVILGVNFFLAASNMNYVWKWTGVSKYFVYDKITTIDAPFDGTIRIVNGKVTIEGLEDSESIKIPKDYKIQIESDEQVFEGDTIAQTSSLATGPFINGLIITLKISGLSAILALLIGMIIAFMRMSSYTFLNDIGTVYVSVIRGTPLLVQIFIFYFIIATIFSLDRFLAGVLSLGIFFGGYIAEVLRGAIQSIDKGQTEAAKSVGMNYFQTMQIVVLPQAFKRALPTLVGEMIALVKDSSLVSVISITDLTKAGREVVANTFAPFETWIIIALMYFSITFILSVIGHQIEKRMKTQGGM
ncbi:MAG: ABC transporter permease [Proteobacteria bacterium]|nr:MAG: ABC transporter permease [Pseudomonadota bacterium]